MQDELAAEFPNLDITLYAVNEAGYEAGNATMLVDRDLGLLQDTVGIDVWGSWQVTWRDFVILGGQNEVVSVYNLTTYNLGTEANYDEVKAALVTAAEAL